MASRSPLVQVSELVALLADRDAVTVLDVRYRMGETDGAARHAAGHVPTASYVDLETDLAGPPGGAVGGRHPLPEPADFAAAMRRCGVRADRPVVIYDDWQGLAAGRCWWLLRHHGHHDVRLLDGGWGAWLAEGGDVETGAPQVAAGDFEPTAAAGAEAVTAEELLAVEVVLDARAPERYLGDHEPVDPVAGHVPGALNVPTALNLTADGRFRSVEELQEVYAAVGAVLGADVAVYCGSGVTAVHDIVALELLGVRARLYPGSWSEWSADPGRPVERGGVG
jgi:thiosulfate/3-mercaptopyruvate sulfurtransferase